MKWLFGKIYFCNLEIFRAVKTNLPIAFDLDQKKKYLLGKLCIVWKNVKHVIETFI